MKERSEEVTLEAISLVLDQSYTRIQAALSALSYSAAP